MQTAIKITPKRPSTPLPISRTPTLTSAPATQPMEESACTRQGERPSGEHLRLTQPDVEEGDAGLRFRLTICASLETCGTSVLAPTASMSTQVQTSNWDAVVPVVTTTHWIASMVVGMTVPRTDTLDVSRVSVAIQVPVLWVPCATVISLTQRPLRLKSLPARQPKPPGDMPSTTMQIQLPVSTVETESRDVPSSFTTVRMMRVMADSHARRPTAVLDQELHVVSSDQPGTGSNLHPSQQSIQLPGHQLISAVTDEKTLKSLISPNQLVDLTEPESC